MAIYIADLARVWSEIYVLWFYVTAKIILSEKHALI